MNLNTKCNNMHENIQEHLKTLTIAADLLQQLQPRL